MPIPIFDAIVKFDPLLGVSVIFTPDGEKAVTAERFERFDIACGQQTVRQVIAFEGLSIQGYIPEDVKEPLVSMWALAVLVNQIFGINTDVIAPA